MSRKLEGLVLAPHGFITGTLEFGDDGRISSVAGLPIDEERVRGHGGALILPGFIDLHVHGGRGRDIMEGGDAAAEVARCHAEHGTTALLATTMTAPHEDLARAFEGLRDAVAARAHGAARILGVHLEGPFINSGKLGAQPDFARPVSMQELAALHAVAPIRLVTLAPEVPGHMEAVQALTRAGFRVQLGHTLASYEEGVEAMARGARGVTHLFNAMTPLHHRAPGVVGAALAHARYAEIIPDLLHVHPGAIRVALRAIPRVYCVTDSTAATGMPDGEYRLGRHAVTKCMGGVRLDDGTLAGSTLTMDEALRNLVERLGLSLADASRRVSTFAAEYLGLTDRGTLREGAWGDVVVLDRDLRLSDVFVEGAAIGHTHAA
ncbi:MAG TPA: N-acetylglucosamine-6-phosphate deacetylase [Ramlibacter sp.]|uniref:N-acetylglucosamine-6-phosphate deacetylase n=1 Tax=Ramlibacter sp. TaxID=1917967 RepID=UPI002CE22E43|nr:N-acetylglucosamine-6-phosphate deacetylase [Ramlibacter sp.]HVZ45688.1 N-acetylglucosamine-6-phosphate deacetylase [Ramlibacter sp.]